MKTTFSNGFTARVRWTYGAKGHEGISKNETKCTVDVSTLEGEYKCVGSTKMNPKDTFSKEKARKVSLTRALKDAHIDREDRESIWKMYFNRKLQK